MTTFNQISQSAGYAKDDVAVSVTVCGGSYGGGSEVLVLQEYTTLQDGTNTESMKMSAKPCKSSGEQGGQCADSC